MISLLGQSPLDARATSCSQDRLEILLLPFALGAFENPGFALYAGEFYSRRKIRKGEELTVDYNFDHTDDLTNACAGKELPRNF
jgi:hypothetical protein